MKVTSASAKTEYGPVALVFATRLCVVAFLAIVATFHVLRPDVNPVARGISRYQWGPYGTAMSVGFLLLAVALLGSAQVTQRRHLRNTFSSTLLYASALGSLLVAATPLPESPSFSHAVAHQLGGFVLFAAAALATGIAPTNNGEAAVRRLGRLTAGLVIVFFLTIVVNVPLVGLVQRVVLAAMCAWIATITRTTAHARRQSAPTTLA